MTSTPPLHAASTAEPQSPDSSTAPKSQGDLAVLYAYRLGYRVSRTGQILNPDGISIKLSSQGKNSSRYPFFRLRNPEKNPDRRTAFLRINAGRLAAYCYWKDQIFQPGIVVARGICGPPTDLSRDNLALVTRAQRQRHRSRSLRKAQASHAASSKPTHARGRRLTDAQAQAVRALFLAGTPKSQIARGFSVSETVIRLICAGRTYRNTLNP